MPRIVKKMPSPQGVAAGQTAIFDVPVGLKFHSIQLGYKVDGTDATEAQFKAHIKAVRVILDGYEKIPLSATDLIAINKFYQEPWNDGVLPIRFSRPWQRSATGEDNPGYGTADVSRFTVEVDIDAAALNPTLELFAEQYPYNEPLGQHVVIKRFAHENATTGETEIPDLPTGKYGLMAVHFDKETISNFTLEMNQRALFDRMNKKNLLAMYRDRRDWQTGYFHADLVHTNRLDDTQSLRGLEDFRLRFDKSDTGSFNILMERVEGSIPAS